MKFFNNRFTRSISLAAVAAALMLFQPGVQAARHGGGHGGGHHGGHAGHVSHASHGGGHHGGIAHRGGGRGGIAHHGAVHHGGAIAHRGGGRGGIAHHGAVHHGGAIAHRGGARGHGFGYAYHGPHSRAWRNGWRPHPGYVLVWGDGYDGPGYYYGPPGLAYYGPGVAFYSSLGAAPVEIRVGIRG